ncbi:alpha/beta fold hydrolase [Streptomyces sp. NPDC060028]|uniref:alpha/beta fold hydrolase n=1 Tax=Streptomyces sp. NPDC060028 TaxID=3347041 RepID=UPI0036B180E0
MASILSTTLNVTARVAPGLAGRAAFALFVKPLGRPRVRPGEAGTMAEAVVGRVVVDGMSVTTYRWGDGERPVLVVHGWSSRVSRFAGFVEGLRAQGRSVVAFDAPGHGESGGRATTIRLQREIIRRLHQRYGDFSGVVAHSFGVLSTFFALRDGSDGVGGGRSGNSGIGGVRADRIVGIGGIADFDYLAAQFRGNLGLTEAVERALRGHVQERLFPDEPGIWPRFDVCRDPGEIAADILLVHDLDDDVAPPAQSRSIARAYGARARLIETRGLGHRRILADPGVIEAAVDFLAEHASARSEENAR